ncbi:MAG: methionyl-tRNA formyltransferase [Oceanicaulis sp.]|uniref:methionyl-tRNA formyltransferase n=1 Tax=unclassified Oceanicaulis TaxID=2632123 RepID=UPI000C5FDBCD|nr:MULTISPECIES: methionyl-tRNA formyltransferase [unclassified Oceanicaulis]MAB68882.1 methionyl-tRNA formyltransferase [Oceanicaulis sp.]MBC38043.1 methionyl-tRNA formyltransferase [Oceanicaulis sp.]HCR95162.1 methionyl-tRNA formyltransferase [Oceanicaulis sp.]
MTLRLAFMGTPDFAAASLAEIVGAGHEVVAVYTQPERPRGRGQTLVKTPVHQLAEQFGLTVHTPESFRDPDVIAQFESLDLDAACVVAYGQILPQQALDAPRLGCLNLHASLLPRWRGAAPIQRAIMAGDEMTGVQIMQMEAGLDTGPVLMSEVVPISETDTAASLHDRLMSTGALLWPRTLAALERGSLNAAPQSEEGVTYAKKITREEARINWSKPASEVADHIRGLSPFPGAYFELPGDKPVRVKVHFAQPEAGDGEPGEALDDSLLIACGRGAVRLVRLQREGKGVMDAKAFLNGVDVPKGTVLA